MRRFFVMILALVMVTTIGVSTPASTRIDGKLRLEGENGIFAGGARSYNYPAASNGKVAAYIMNIGDSITFTNIPKTNGLIIGYAIGTAISGKLSLYVNGIYKQDILFPSTGGYGKNAMDYKEVSLVIDIPENSSIKLQIDKGDASANIDYIDLLTSGNMSDLNTTIKAGVTTTSSGIDNGALANDNPVTTEKLPDLTMSQEDITAAGDKTTGNAVGTALNGIVKLVAPTDDLNPPMDAVKNFDELNKRLSHLVDNCRAGIYKVYLSGFSKSRDMEKIRSAVFIKSTMFGKISKFTYNYSKDNLLSLQVRVTKSLRYELAKTFSDENYLNTTTDGTTKTVYPIVKNILTENIKPGMTDYEKELAIHDYMVKNYRYRKGNASVAGMLINKTGVCQAYADSFKTFMSLLGIPCFTQTGKVSRGGHAWNVVMLDGEYYNVDVTWDDPTPDVPGRAFHTYFNVTDQQLKRNHSWNAFPGISATSTKYSYK